MAIRRLSHTALIAVAALSCKATPYREIEVDLTAANSERSSEPRADGSQPFRFSVAAMQSPRDAYAGYSQLLSHVGRRLGVELAFVQRRTYREVNDLLIDGHLEAAFLCPGGYAELQRRAPGGVEVLAVPIVGGKPTYQSLIIVPVASSAIALTDLAGKRFAFTDELSLSGRAYALHKLGEMKEDPARFFGRTLFTHSHDRSVEAVANGLADGAAVDSLVYEYLAARNPDLVAKTRVIHRSPPFGMMPLVASTRLPAATRARLREIVLGLDRDPAATAALHALRIERFVVPEPGLYDEAIAVMDGIR